MTHHTDADRAEFEHWARNDFYACLASVGDTWNSERGMYSDAAHHMAFHAWQAARRAQAAPVPQPFGYVVTTPAGVDLFYRHHASFTIYNDHRAETVYTLAAVLAAAPRSPQAAPVELPEPAYFLRTINGSEGTRIWFDTKPDVGATPVYTEQQVRQLLANHGIQERST